MTRYHETSAATAQNVEVGKSLKSLKMIVIGVCVFASCESASIRFQRH